MCDYAEKMLTVRKKSCIHGSKHLSEYIFSSHILRSAGAETALIGMASLLQSNMQAISCKIS